jgi:hypothetical protein
MQLAKTRRAAHQNSVYTVPTSEGQYKGTTYNNFEATVSRDARCRLAEIRRGGAARCDSDRQHARSRELADEYGSLQVLDQQLISSGMNKA